MTDGVHWNTECDMRIRGLLPSLPDDGEESGSLCNRIDHLLVVATPGWSGRAGRRSSHEGK